MLFLPDAETVELRTESGAPVQNRTAILQTKRQIYIEARPFLYRISTLGVDINSKMWFAPDPEAPTYYLVFREGDTKARRIHPTSFADVSHVMVGLYFDEGNLYTTQETFIARYEDGTYYPKKRLDGFANVARQAHSMCEAIRSRQDAKKMRLTVGITWAILIVEKISLKSVEAMFTENVLETLNMFRSLENAEVKLVSGARPRYSSGWRKQLSKDLQALLDAEAADEPVLT